MSKKMGDRQPLNESIDNEDATSNDVTPETCSTERTSSTAKRTDAKKSQKEKRKSEMEQQTSKIVKDSPYNEKQTCEKKKDSNLEIILEEDDYKQMNNVKTNDTGTLCLDDDRIIIDADKFLETSKYDTKQRSKGKVIFLEDNEHFRDQNMESYKVDEDVKTADQSQNVNVKSIYSTRIERSLQILNEKEADKPENEQNKDGVFDSAQMSRVKKETRETDTISQNEAVVTKDNDVESSYPSKDIQERDTVETDTDRICKASGHHKDQKVRSENEVETNKTLALAKNKTNLRKSISEKHKKKELHVNVKSFNDEKIDNNKEGKIKENIKSEKIAVINTGQSGEADNLIVVPQLPTDGIKCMDQETPENHSSLELLRCGEQEQFLDKRLSTPAVETTFDQEQDVHTEKQKRTGKKKKHELKDDPHKSIMVKTEDSTTHRKKKTGKVKIGKSKGKSKGRKELSKIKDQESSSVDPNKGIKMNEVPYVNGLFNNENERRSEDLQEINSVNENQLTAVQAWASVDMETDNTHKFNDRDSNLTYDEDKETNIDTYVGNEDGNLNKMDSEELLELRPLSSLAPLSTLMREETSSSFIYHNYKTVQKSAEFEIYHRHDSPALKTTGLKGSEDSSSLTKVDESLSSLRILDIEQ
ncbi:DNA ligase 1-like [Saccostrea cucullata]|uniref:DNA ligase 1-like n=1 Tax=Saccostrea cuccullata TaxID=36930 RepID=UPI002ECFE8ED